MAMTPTKQGDLKMKNFKNKIKTIGQLTIAIAILTGTIFFTVQLFQDLATVQPNVLKILSK